MTKVARRALVLLLALSLLLAACGGSDGKKAASSEGGATTTTTVGASVGGSSVADLAQKCQAAVLAMATAQSKVLTGVNVDDSVKQLQAAAAAAPKAIKDDLAVLTAAYADLGKALQAAGFDPAKPPTSPADMAKYAGVLASIGERFSDPKLSAASDRIEAWFDGGCKG